MNAKQILVSWVVAGLMIPAAAAQEENIFVEFRALSPTVALELAQETLKACQKDDYQVAVAVVDRMGVTQVLLRDRYAGPHTPLTAWRKAWTAVSFRVDTLQLSALTAGSAPQAGARFIDNALMIGGGVPVEAAGSVVAGVGVSGGPTGEVDDACARAAIETLQGKLQM